MFNNFKNKNKGFTLVEIIVASGVFMVIMVAALGSLLIVSNHAEKAKALRAAMDNVNYAMDTMSRSLRLGSNYNCSSNISLPSSSLSDCTGGTEVSFYPSGSSTGNTKFVLSTSSPKSIQKCTTSGGCVDLTSPDVEVTNLRFVVRGTDAFDGIQPSVYILMKGTVTVNAEKTEFALQTLASQRDIE